MSEDRSAAETAATMTSATTHSLALDAHTRAVVTAELLDNLFVEAGAGTGKTTLLVSRVLALVDEGRSLRSIAAITFTEKAAAELRDRLRGDLAQRGRRDLLDELDDATITTIHGFARSILATHAMRAGLPVELEMVVDVEAAARFADEYARFADRLLSGEVRPESMRRAVALGLNRRNLESVVYALHTERHRVALVDAGAVRRGGAPRRPAGPGAVVHRARPRVLQRRARRAARRRP